MIASKPNVVLFILAGLLGGCAEIAVPEPVLDRVCLADSEPDCLSVAPAGSPAELILLGLHFHPGYQVDLSDESPPILGNFSAQVGDTAIEQLALAAGRDPGQEALTGVLPGSLDMGIYDVELETPGGQTTRLLDGFLIGSPLHLLATAEVGRAPVGHSIGLSVVIENLGSISLEAVEISISQDGDGSLLLPLTPAPFGIEAGGSHIMDLGLQASLEGAVSVGLTALASTDNGLSVDSGGPVQVNLTVLRAATISVSTWASPSRVSVSDEFEVMVEVSCQGQTPALEVGLLGVEIGGDGLVELGPVPSQLVDIPAESQRIFQLTGTATGPGSVELTVGAQGLEAISGRQLGPITADPIVIEIQ